ncbi:MAG: hypothetical protein OHK0046_32440 [Anaerolineae bacterium]
MQKWFVVLVMVVLLGAALGLAVAQDDAESTLTCDAEDLAAQQADLSAQLMTFAEAVEEDPDATLAALYEVGVAYQALALECGHIPANANELTVGTDMALILRVLDEVNGDPLNGQLLYNNEADAADGSPVGCVNCHMDAAIAPLTEGTWTRWDEIRRLEPQFEDYTFKQYMVESIIHPWDYTVPGYPEGTMPNNFGDRLSYQNLADLITYLESQDQLLDD